MVPDSEHRGADHFPPGFLRVPGGQEVVGAVLQAALAWHYRHLSQGDQAVSHHVLLFRDWPCFVYLVLGGFLLCSFQGLVIGKLGQKRVIARVVRRTVMRKLFSCQQFSLGIFYLNLSSLLAVKWEIFWSEFQSRWWLNIILKILSPLIHSVYQTLLLKTQEEVSRHGGALVNYLYGAIFLGLNLQSVLWRNFKVSLEIAKNSRTIKNIAQ